MLSLEKRPREKSPLLMGDYNQDTPTSVGRRLSMAMKIVGRHHGHFEDALSHLREWQMYRFLGTWVDEQVVRFVVAPGGLASRFSMQCREQDCANCQDPSERDGRHIQMQRSPDTRQQHGEGIGRGFPGSSPWCNWGNLDVAVVYLELVNLNFSGYEESCFLRECLQLFNQRQNINCLLGIQCVCETKNSAQRLDNLFGIQQFTNVHGREKTIFLGRMDAASDIEELEPWRRSQLDSTGREIKEIAKHKRGRGPEQRHAHSRGEGLGQWGLKYEKRVEPGTGQPHGRITLQITQVRACPTKSE
ncbi:hypothetical protein DFH07DRAFT_785777 [Mycena maculata]|uniref:Uncharacterized protein n=1 Tax=Mycena maculata TaxID=230809 RepID=A0AAD7H888_9AGAR|nr:hypothetical protein DFH07DRAFT_785777 [Mycena maculata]